MLITLMLAGPHAAKAQDRDRLDLSHDYEWKPLLMGAGGFVTGVVLHPEEPGLIYGRTDVGNAYRWSEDDEVWTPLITDASMPAGMPPRSHGVASIAVDPTDPDVVYMAFAAPDEEGTIYRSADRGASWTPGDLRVKIAPNGLGRLDGERLAVDFKRPNTLFYGSNNNGLWQSQDAGATWKQITNGIAKDLDVREVLVDPQAAIVYCIAREDAVYRSTDGGSTFAAITGGPDQPPTGNDWRDADLGPDSTLYVLSDRTSGISGNASASVWRFDAKSSKWSEISPAGNQASYIDLAVNPFDANHLHVALGNGQSFRSLDGGTTWSKRLAVSRGEVDVPWHAWTNENWFSTADIAFDPHVRNRLWTAQGIGVWRTSDIFDHEVTWAGVSAGIEELVCNAVIAPPGGDPITMVWDRTGYRHENLDAFPVDHLPGDGVEGGNDFSSGWDVTYSAQNSDFVAIISEDYRDRKPHFSGWSDDGGKTWNVFESIGDPQLRGKDDPNETHPPRLSFGNIAVSATDVDRMVWLPGTGDVPYVTANRGKTWQPSKGTPGNLIGAHYRNVKALAADPIQGNVFWLWNHHFDGGILRSDDFGKTFSPIVSKGLPEGGLDNFVHGKFAVTPGQSGHLWICDIDQIKNPTDGGLYHSTDGGKSFQRVGPFQKPIQIGFGKAAPGSDSATVFVYGVVGQDYGLYRSINDGRSWA
jgi:hypothetical protein